MGIRVKPLVSAALATIGTSMGMATAAIAQEVGPRTESALIPEAVNEISYGNSGTYFENRTPWRQFSYIFGPGGFGSAAFPESEIERDAEAVNQVYEYLMAEQTRNDPYLRTPDLRNPYNSSVLLLPVSQQDSRVVGSEFVFERLPLP
ncbi:MAG: hypothetical protein HC886_02235 [Leptolyngbyaceae cyanobacterium SM1_1_3]|nr:hypothetical protein [Leptolyngbyaceae cyanobacterium SM1_1_3]NJN02789.1 hypothetical protein [Leptolyngbyaceae cyanobacterium RM1_1_2]NJO11203.1 hypothetical protein [Leptolyngbyaceae cyanobacterium SL_1_1]